MLSRKQRTKISPKIYWIKFLIAAIFFVATFFVYTNITIASQVSDQNLESLRASVFDNQNISEPKKENKFLENLKNSRSNFLSLESRLGISTGNSISRVVGAYYLGGQKLSASVNQSLRVITVMYKSAGKVAIQSFVNFSLPKISLPKFNFKFIAFKGAVEIVQNIGRGYLSAELKFRGIVLGTMQAVGSAYEAGGRKLADSAKTSLSGFFDVSEGVSLAAEGNFHEFGRGIHDGIKEGRKLALGLYTSAKAAGEVRKIEATAQNQLAAPSVSKIDVVKNQISDSAGSFYIQAKNSIFAYNFWLTGQAAGINDVIMRFPESMSETLRLTINSIISERYQLPEYPRLLALWNDLKNFGLHQYAGWKCRMSIGPCAPSTVPQITIEKVSTGTIADTLKNILKPGEPKTVPDKNYLPPAPQSTEPAKLSPALTSPGKKLTADVAAQIIGKAAPPPTVKINSTGNLKLNGDLTVAGSSVFGGGVKSYGDFAVYPSSPLDAPLFFISSAEKKITVNADILAVSSTAAFGNLRVYGNVDFSGAKVVGLPVAQQTVNNYYGGGTTIITAAGAASNIAGQYGGVANDFSVGQNLGVTGNITLQNASSIFTNNGVSYLKGRTVVSSDILPSADGTVNLGAANGKFGNIYANTIRATSFFGDGSGLTGLITDWSATRNYGTTVLTPTSSDTGLWLKNGIYASSTIYSSGATSTFENGILLATNSGNVGIRTSSPAFTLDVNGIVNANALYVGGAPYIGSQWTTSGSNIYYNIGNIGIGTAGPADKLSVHGGNISIANGSATTTLGANFFAVASSTTDMLGKFYVDSAGNVSASGTVYANFFSGNGSLLTNLPLAGQFTYYLYGTDSAVLGLNQMLSSPTSTDVASSTPNVTNGQTIANWITNAGFPGVTFIPAGSFVVHLHAAQSAGAEAAQLYGEIWETDSSGNDIAKIGTSEMGTALGASETEYGLNFVTADVYTMASVSSRIKLKLKAVVSGIGTAPTVVIYEGGEADSHIALPSNTVDANFFVPYSGATANLDLGSHSLQIGTQSGYNLGKLSLDSSGNLSASGTVSVLGSGTSTFAYGATFATIGGNVSIGTSTAVANLVVQDNANQVKDLISFAGSGGSILGGISSQGYLVGGLEGSLTVNSLSTPGAPTVTATGSGATTWTYKITAVTGSRTGGNAAIATAAGAGASVTNAATLDGSHYNTITWSPVAGASAYNIYRTAVGTSPATTGIIGSVDAMSPLSFVDNGVAGDGFGVPTQNGTGLIMVPNGVNPTSPGLSFIGDATGNGNTLGSARIGFSWAGGNGWDFLNRSSLTTAAFRLSGLSAEGIRMATPISFTTGVGTGPDIFLSRIAANVLGVGKTSGLTDGTFVAGYVGVGTSTPFARLSVVGPNSLTQDAFVVATSTDGSSLLKVKGSNGDVSFGNDGFLYEASSSISYINSIETTGGLNFPDDAGIVSRSDLNVTANSPAGTGHGYIDSLNGNPMLFVYGQSDAAGGVTGLTLSVATSTTSTAKMLIDGNGNAVALKVFNGGLSVASNLTNTLGQFYVDTSGNINTSGTISSVGAISSNGTITAAGTITATSGSVVAHRDLGFKINTSASALLGTTVGTDFGVSLASGSTFFVNGTTGKLVSLRYGTDPNSNVEKAYFDNSGQLSIGNGIATSTLSGVTTSTLVGPVLIYNTNTTASTTNLTIQAGGAQSTSDLLTVQDNSGNSLVDINTVQNAFSQPLQVNVSGDVAFGQDLVFTNSDAAYIKSQSPLYIQAGDPGQNTDLVMSAQGTGSIVFNQSSFQMIKDFVGNTSTFRGGFIDINDTGYMTSTIIGMDVDLTGVASGTRYAALFQGGQVGIGTSAPQASLDIENVSSTLATVYIQSPSSGYQPNIKFSATGTMFATPTEAVGNSAFVMDTTATESLSNLLVIRNNGVQKLSIDSAGTALVAGNMTIQSGNLGVDLVRTYSATLLTLQGQQVDGATAVGVAIGPYNTLANSTAKLVSIRNATTEKAYFDLWGGLNIVSDGTATTTISSLVSTSTIASGLSVNNSSFENNASSTITFISSLETPGGLNLPDDAGFVTLANMNITTSTSGLGNSMSLGFNGDPLLQLYAASNGSGGYTDWGVSMGTSTTSTYMLFIDTTSSLASSAALGVRGYVKATGFIASSSTLDIAETYPVSSSCEAAGNCPDSSEVVCSVEDKNTATFYIEKCSATSTENILGVVSGNPGMVLGGYDVGPKDQGLYPSTYKPVALGGRVDIKVSTANGAIKAGDLLTSSGEPGVAIKATEPGRVIGVALQSFEGNKPGTIKIFVNPHWSPGALAEGDISNDNFPDFSLQGLLDNFTLAVKNSLWKLGLLIQNGVAKVKEIFADKVTVNQLCVGQTCVTEEQLKELLQKAAVNPAAPAAATPPPTESAPPPAEVAPPPAETSTSTPTSESAPAPSVEPSPVLPAETATTTP